MTKKVMIDFQEAAEEVKSGFVHTAYAEFEGKLWKMERTLLGKIKFFVELDNEFCLQFPPSGLYFVKWQPVRDK